MQHELATHWNGPWQRPPWWESWQQDEHALLASYRFNLPGQELSLGLLSLTVELHPTEGRQVVVHDFWATTDRAAAAMLAFLGRHNSRIPTVAFQRTGLPPAPVLLRNLHRVGSAAARAWHPWTPHHSAPRNTPATLVQHRVNPSGFVRPWVGSLK